MSRGAACVTPHNGSVTRLELVPVRWTGPLESAALLTAVPVPPRLAASTRGVLRWAPLVGLLLGGPATGVAVLGARWISPLAGAVLAVAVLALLTRGLHLDGLADTADGLGPLRDRERALQVMHQSDVGPFGVVTLVLTLLLQVAGAAALLAADGGWLPLWAAVLVARLAMVRDRPAGRGRRGGLVARPAVGGHGAPRRGWPAPCCSARRCGRRPLLVAVPAGASGCGRPPLRRCLPPSSCTAGDRTPRRDDWRRHGRDVRGGDDGAPADRRRAPDLGARAPPIAVGTMAGMTPRSPAPCSATPSPPSPRATPRPNGLPASGWTG